LKVIVAKRKSGPYLTEQAKLAQDTQPRIFGVGREELFERERGGDPDVWLWDQCVAACLDAVYYYAEKNFVRTR
jgi:hypothetical protein